MPTISDRLNKRFRLLLESNGQDAWKNPHDPSYDRAMAEDALFHTVGPLTDAPHWDWKTWHSKICNKPPPGFQPGSPAPKWTQEEVSHAMAGDPKLLFASRDNPRSPSSGGLGGSPIWRWARQLARK